MGNIGMMIAEGRERGIKLTLAFLVGWKGIIETSLYRRNGNGGKLGEFFKIRELTLCMEVIQL